MGSSSEALERRRAYQRERMRARRAANPEAVRAYDRAWREANPERVRQRRREWDAKNPEKVRAMRLKKSYGITLADWDALFEGQGKRCAVCRGDSPNGKQIWHVDHCHGTGKVRGILCSFCNSMLGYAREREDTLRSAIEYLRGN